MKDLRLMEEEFYGKPAPQHNGISARNWDCQALP